jgi:hypothetical protein
MTRNMPSFLDPPVGRSAVPLVLRIQPCLEACPAAV